MPDAPATRARRPGLAALGFAVAALAASWNVMAAPFGLLVGVGAALLARRALRRSPDRRRLAGAALAVALFAIAASVVVLAITAGSVGVELPGNPVLKARTPEELERILSEAAERTKAERERARAELDHVAGSPRPRAAGDGGPGGARPSPSDAGPAADAGAAEHAAP